MTRTSSISGTFVIRQRSPVNVAAASILSAAFFEPLIGTVPDSARPPSIRKTSWVTGSGTNSQWNGLASAIGVLRGLAAAARPLPVSALGDPLPEQGRLERGAGRRQVDALVVAALEGVLGVAARLLRLLEIDLRREVGGLGHHDDFVGQDLHEPADHREIVLDAAGADPQLTDTQRRDERGVVRQDAQL